MHGSEQEFWGERLLQQGKSQCSAAGSLRRHLGWGRCCTSRWCNQRCCCSPGHSRRVGSWGRRSRPRSLSRPCCHWSRCLRPQTGRCRPGSWCPGGRRLHVNGGSKGHSASSSFGSGLACDLWLRGLGTSINRTTSWGRGLLRNSEPTPPEFSQAVTPYAMARGGAAVCETARHS